MSRQSRALSASLSASCALALLGACTSQGGDDAGKHQQPGVSTGTVIGGTPGKGGTLTVVNELGLEDYVQGVLLGEVPRDWPLEALKAQAIAAR